jgi:valyl-tRNA synthetase
VASLRLALDVLLRLFAPFIPYITEEVWSWAYAEEKGDPSIHRAAWPSAAELDDIAAPASEASFDLAVACWNAINKAKADSEVSMGREVETLTIAADAETLAGLEPVLGDVLAATRCRAHTLAADASVESGSFAVRDARFAPKPD